MAESEVIRELLARVKFVIDPASQRQVDEVLKAIGSSSGLAKAGLAGTDAAAQGAGKALVNLGGDPLRKHRETAEKIRRQQEEVNKSFKDYTRQQTELNKGVATFATALGALALGIGAYLKSSTKGFTDLVVAARSLRTPVAEIKGLAGAAELAGVNFGALLGSYASTIEKIRSNPGIRAISAEWVREFDKSGQAIKDFTSGDPVKQYMALIQTFRTMRDSGVPEWIVNARASIAGISDLNTQLGNLKDLVSGLGFARSILPPDFAEQAAKWKDFHETMVKNQLIVSQRTSEMMQGVRDAADQILQKWNELISANPGLAMAQSFIMSAGEISAKYIAEFVVIRAALRSTLAAATVESGVEGTLAGQAYATGFSTAVGRMGLAAAAGVAAGAFGAGAAIAAPSMLGKPTPEGEEYKRKIQSGKVTFEDEPVLQFFKRLFGGGAPKFQRGGIVNIDAHHGEMVLPEPISTGFQRLFQPGSDVFGRGAGEQIDVILREFMEIVKRLSDRFESWWSGSGGFAPKVDLVDRLKSAMGVAGGAGAGGTVGGAARGAGPASGAPAAPGGAPAAPGGGGAQGSGGTAPMRDPDAPSRFPIPNAPKNPVLPGDRRTGAGRWRPGQTGGGEGLAQYATGNARIGGASSVAGVNPEFSQRIQRMVAAMPPDIRRKFEIISGFRSQERQAQVNPGVTNSHHTYGMGVDTTWDPEVRKWITDNGQRFGVGYTLAGMPNEGNHLEPTENGQRILPSQMAAWVKSHGGAGGGDGKTDTVIPPNWAPDPNAPSLVTSRQSFTNLQRNNPGNLRADPNNNWIGKTTKLGDAFESFDTLEHGIRARAVSYQTYLTRRGANTIAAVAARSGPSWDNNDIPSQIRAYQKALGGKYAGPGGENLPIDPTAENISRLTHAGLSIEIGGRGEFLPKETPQRLIDKVIADIGREGSGIPEGGIPGLENFKAEAPPIPGARLGRRGRVRPGYAISGKTGHGESVPVPPPLSAKPSLPEYYPVVTQGDTVTGKTGQGVSVPIPPPPSAQRGGIVNINAHDGEMVLPPDISKGIRGMFDRQVRPDYLSMFDRPLGGDTIHNMTTNTTNTNDSSRNVEIHQVNNLNLGGFTGDTTGDLPRQLALVHRRVAGDTVRYMKSRMF